MGEPGAFVFRGHSSDTYQLLPSVFRGRGVSFPDRRPVHRRTFYNQRWAELVWLKEFFDLADARGLPLPEDSQELRDTLENCSSPTFVETVASGEAYWPPAKLLSLLALAAIDGSTCFPGFGGVVRALKERLRQPPPGSTAQLRRAQGSRRRYAEFWRALRRPRR